MSVVLVLFESTKHQNRFRHRENDQSLKYCLQIKMSVRTETAWHYDFGILVSMFRHWASEGQESNGKSSNVPFECSELVRILHALLGTQTNQIPHLNTDTSSKSQWGEPAFSRPKTGFWGTSIFRCVENRMKNIAFIFFAIWISGSPYLIFPESRWFQ